MKIRGSKTQSIANWLNRDHSNRLANGTINGGMKQNAIGGKSQTNVTTNKEETAAETGIMKIC